MKKNEPSSNPPRDEGKASPQLNRVLERNLRKIVYMRIKAKARRGLQDRISDAITSISGRMVFVYFHIVWFGAWLLINLSLVGVEPFDPYPFGLLTMIVSLEAIFLSTFVLISQNKLSQEAEQRADLDMHINLLAEHELTLVLQMLESIQDKLGIDTSAHRELADLETEIKPEDVLREIENLQEKLK